MWVAVLVFCTIADGTDTRLSLTALWMAAFFLFMYFAVGLWRLYYLVLSLMFVAFVPSWATMSHIHRSELLAAAFVSAGLLDHFWLARAGNPWLPVWRAQIG